VETLTAEAFIGKLLMHIPPKHFKMVRAYGIYAGSIRVKVKQCFGLLQYIKSGYKAIRCTLKEYYRKETKKLTYRELMIRNFSKDPCKCNKCGELMELWQVWHRKYGIFMSWRNIKRAISGKQDEVPFGKIEKDKLIDFKCKRCGYEEKVPDFVAFECYTEEDFDKESGSPVILYPKCDGNMILVRMYNGG